MKFNFLLVLPFCISFGDVSKFLNPLSISSPQSNKKIILGTKSSALISPNSNISSSPSLNKGFEFDQKHKINLTSSEIERKLGQTLQYRYQCGGMVSAKLTRVWQAIEVSPNYIVKIIDSMPDELSPSSFVRFEIWDQGKLVMKYGEPLRIAHFVDVFVAKNKLVRGSDLSNESFAIQPVDILRHNAGAVPATNSLAGYELSSSVNVGAALKWNNLSKVNLVRKGEIVDVFASGGGIYISMKGVSLDNGVQDGIVRIRNLSSDKEFQAKVLNRNSVKVNL